MGDWLGGDSHFAILEVVNNGKNYAKEHSSSLAEKAEIRKVVSVPDDMLNSWMPHFMHMATYWESTDRPNTGLARTGVTLIPPESLSVLIDIVSSKTEPSFSQLDEYSTLVELLRAALEEKKFVINYGI
jgi:hypothetical protein